MATQRFQPGDKVRAKYPHDLGLMDVDLPVSAVDDFGNVQLAGRTDYLHRTHFELVSRAGATGNSAGPHLSFEAETYCLLDSEGDWWVWDGTAWAANADNIHRFADFHTGFEAGIDQIKARHGIDAEPTAPAETYCLKDSAGDWWFSEDGETFRCACLCCAEGSIPTTLGQFLALDAHGGIDAEPTAPAYSEGASPADTLGNSTGPSLHFEAAPAFTVGQQVSGDDYDRLPEGTVVQQEEDGPVWTKTPSGWLFGSADRVGGMERPPNRRALRAIIRLGYEAHDSAPLAVGDWVKVLARVEHVYDNGSIRAQTFRSDGSRNGRTLYAIASAITRTDEVPEWAQEPETYCLRDSDGHWWVSTDPETDSDMRYDPVLARWPARIGSTWKVAN